MEAEKFTDLSDGERAGVGAEFLNDGFQGKSASCSDTRIS
jgi:hypothetical protein